MDQASGTSEERTQYKRMMAAAQKRQLDAVLVWRYDRFARSTQALVNALKEFQSLGGDFISYQENIDTTTPMGELVFHVMASLAQFESALISQRVRAGMARAKAQGKHVARPRLVTAKQEAIAQLLSEGLSMNQVSKQLGVAYGTVYNYAQKLKNA
ncbi:recombinase family protein [Hymenobacter jeollabukensis]|uniref:recombinase family protein n=1 Tax=Hymenobacter jeollabukensis TaxID=2025313 RepID=UPI001FE44826|nr:recombinase family protein [Hymenobacter jeollabukensis]